MVFRCGPRELQFLDENAAEFARNLDPNFGVTLAGAGNAHRLAGEKFEPVEVTRDRLGELGPGRCPGFGGALDTLTANEVRDGCVANVDPMLGLEPSRDSADTLRGDRLLKNRFVKLGGYLESHCKPCLTPSILRLIRRKEHGFPCKTISRRAL